MVPSPFAVCFIFDIFEIGAILPSQVMTTVSEWHHTLNDLIAGTLGGCAGIIVGHPLDTVKLRIQTHIAPTSAPLQRSVNPGMMHILTNMISREGPLSLFRGLAPPLIGNAPMNAAAFASYGNASRVLKPYYPDTEVGKDILIPPVPIREGLVAELRSYSPGLTLDQLDWKSTFTSQSVELSLERIFLAGCWSGFVTSFITTPVEVLKCRLQGAGSRYRGLWDCAVGSVRELGVGKGLFQGIVATMIRDTPAMGVYFGVYEGIKRWGRTSTYTPSVRTDMPTGSSRNELPLRVAWTHAYEHSVQVLLCAGALAGMLSWVVTYPVDTIKSVIQTQHATATTTAADASRDKLLRVGRRIVRERGMRGLWAGITPTCVRALPVNAATLFCYEHMLSYLNARLMRDKKL